VFCVYNPSGRQDSVDSWRNAAVLFLYCAEVRCRNCSSSSSSASSGRGVSGVNASWELGGRSTEGGGCREGVFPSLPGTAPPHRGKSLGRGKFFVLWFQNGVLFVNSEVLNLKLFFIVSCLSGVRVNSVANFDFRAKQWIKDTIKCCHWARTINIGLLYPNVRNNIGGDMSPASPAGLTPVRGVAPPWPRRMACLEVGRNRSSVVAELVCPARARTTRP